MADDVDGVHHPELLELLETYLEKSLNDVKRSADLARARKKNRAAAAAYRERKRLEHIRLGSMSGDVEKIAAATGARIPEIKMARSYVRNKRRAHEIRERNRDMLALHRHGWTYRQISERFGISERQVGKIIRRERATAHCADPLGPLSSECPGADPRG